MNGYRCRLCKTPTSRITTERLCHACDPLALPFRRPAKNDGLSKSDGAWVNDNGIQRWVWKRVSA